MLLAIDQGNTRTKFGVFDGDALLRTWDVATDKAADGTTLAQLLWTADLPPDTPIGLCSVVPELREAWITATDALGYPLTVITGESPTQLRNGYATPATLGPDRLMAAVAAACVLGAPPVIPVSLGTATVVDAVDADGAYLGGMIAPGIAAAARALADAASALTVPDWTAPVHAIGRTSTEAQQSGLFHFALGGIAAMLAATRAVLGPDTPALLTGGWAERVAPYLDGPVRVEAHLVLRGIARSLTAYA